MLGFYNYTVILTYTSLVSAVFGISLAVNGNITGAIFCLLLSGFCDTFDGKIARTLKRSKEEEKFGIQIDSLSDLVAFGVLPAFIGYSLGLNNWWGIVIMSIFVLTALIRLAYFNVLEEERQSKTKTTRKSYLGLPVTSDALIIPFIYLFRNVFAENFYILYALALVVIAILFVSKIEIRKPSLKAMIIMTIAGVIELVLVVWLIR